MTLTQEQIAEMRKASGLSKSQIADMKELFNNSEPQEAEPYKIKPVNYSKDYTPAGLAKRSAANISALLRMPIYNEDFNTAKQNAQANIEINAQKHPVVRGISEFVTDLAGYSMLPMGQVAGTAGKLAKVGNFVKNAAVQGSLPGALEAVKRGDNAGAGAIGGATIAGLVQSLPYVGKGVKFLGDKLYYNSYPGIKANTVRQLVKPNSKALDLNEKAAQNLLMDTTERVQNNYNALLNQRGDTVGNLLKTLPEKETFKAKDLNNLYDSILNSYSLSKNANLNPAKNASAKELSKIQDLLYGDGKQRFSEYSESIKDLEFPKNYLDVIRGRYKNKYHTKVLDTIGNDIVRAERNFNTNVLEPLRKNPEILQNPELVAQFEKEVDKIAKFSDDELNQRFYDKFYEAVEKGKILQEGENYVNPKELYDINKNINNMIDWDKPGSELKNNVLEQIYLANAKKISDLSPALKAANKAYADLMDFKKNEGIRRILNTQNNIDTASSALRNYNSTVTKGNTNRNIQDLEKILTDNGYEPFLNDIDDVNAATEYLETIKTGFNPLGITDKIKLLEKPLLLAHRKINQIQIPPKVQKISNLLSKTGKIMPAAAVKTTAPLLYGDVEYIENRN